MSHTAQICFVILKNERKGEKGVNKKIVIKHQKSCPGKKHVDTRHGDQINTLTVVEGKKKNNNSKPTKHIQVPKTLVPSDTIWHRHER